VRQIADRFHVHHSNVSRALKRIKEDGSFYPKPRPGCPKALTERDVCAAAFSLANTSALNATDLRNKKFPHVHPQTLRRALHSYGLHSRVRRAKPLLRQINVKKRRDWAVGHFGWDATNWRKVIFSDESKFMLINSAGRDWCWRRDGESLDPRFTKKTVKHGGGSLMVWGCMTAHGVGRLHRIQGTMTGQVYTDILSKAYLGTLTDHNINPATSYFAQDNDPKHKSKVASQWFQSNNIRLLPWPAQSPDMNPIEHLWAEMDRRMRKRERFPKNVEELWDVLQEEWKGISMDIINTLYDSMPRRVTALKKAKGWYTKY
jgi:transposase